MIRGSTLSVVVRGVAALLLLVLLTAFIRCIDVRAGEAAPVVAVRGGSPMPALRMTPGVSIALVLAAAILLATALGVRAARREGGWPHWRALPRGLGEAGFLLALLDALLNTRLGMEEIIRLGAALTPVDLAAGVRQTATVLMAGAALALLGLLGAGAVRLASRCGAAAVTGR